MKRIDVSTKKYPNTYTLVDDDDYEYLNQWKWHTIKTSNSQYVNRTVFINKKKTYNSMARKIMKAPKGMVVDHINGNTLDNRKQNLRICTIQQNSWNKKKQNSLYKYKGVQLRKDRGNWRACITYNNKFISLGSFKTELEAAKAYNTKALELYGEYAKLNKIC